MKKNETKTHTVMRKKIITMIMAVFVAVVPTKAQVFIMEDDESLNPRDPNGSITFNVMVPTEDTNTDQYIPLGEGVLLLSGLAGAYLLHHRHKNEASTVSAAEAR